MTSISLEVCLAAEARWFHGGYVQLLRSALSRPGFFPVRGLLWASQSVFAEVRTCYEQVWFKMESEIEKEQRHAALCRFMGRMWSEDVVANVFEKIPEDKLK